MLIVVSVAWCVAIVRRRDGVNAPAFAAWFAIVLLAAVAVYPWLVYAQREHMLLLLGLPYLVMAAGRLEGFAPPTWEAVAAGASAALGFALKPHHFIIVAAVEALVAYRLRSVRAVVRPETAALAITCVGYGAAIWLWAPDYIVKVVPLARATYLDYQRVPLSELILPIRAAKIGGLIALWALLFSRLRHRALSTVLLISALGATCGYVIQHNGQVYRFLPAMALFTTLFGVILVDLFLRWTVRWQRPLSSGVAAAVAVVTAVAVGMLVYPLQSRRAATHFIDGRIAAQLAISRNLPKGTNLLIIAPATEEIFDAVLKNRLEWGSRFSSLWMLSGIFRHEYGDLRDNADERSRTEDAARLTQISLREDLERWRPNPVLVERCDDDTIEPCISLEDFRVNVLDWFKQDPGFAATWSKYALLGRIGPYDVWCLRTDEGICRRALAAVQGEPSGIDEQYSLVSARRAGNHTGGSVQATP